MVSIMNFLTLAQLGTSAPTGSPAASAAAGAAKTGAGQQQSWWTTLIFVGVMILVFWLLLIRPQQKQRKKQEEFITALKNGDKVVTAAGLIGRIVNIAGDVATIELAQDVRVKIVKSQIVSHYTEAAEEKKPE